MRALFDKETGLWKLGKDGVPKWKTRAACEEEWLHILAERLKKLKERIEYAK